MQIVRKIFRGGGTDGLVAVSGAGVQSNIAGTIEEAQVLKVAIALSQPRDGLEVAAHRPGGHRGGKGIDDAQPRLRRVARQFGAGLLDRLADADGARRYFHRRHHGTGDRQHERGGIAEVAVELNRSGAARQVGAQLIQLQVDVGELLLLVLYAVVQLDVNHGQARKAERANAEVRRAGRPDGQVLGGDVFDRPGDELLNLRSGCPRPRTLRRSHPHRNVGVLALRHFVVAVPAPQEGRHQQDERHLAVLGEEPRSVMRGGNDLGVALVMYAHGSLPIARWRPRDDLTESPLLPVHP